MNIKNVMLSASLSAVLGFSANASYDDPFKGWGYGYAYGAKKAEAYPKGFNGRDYVLLNHDLFEHAQRNKLDLERFGKQHYLSDGKKEGRNLYSMNLPVGFDPVIYVQMYVDLINHAAKIGMSHADFGRVHYTRDGRREQRKYSPYPFVNEFQNVALAEDEVDIIVKGYEGNGLAVNMCGEIVALGPRSPGKEAVAIGRTVWIHPDKWAKYSLPNNNRPPVGHGTFRVELRKLKKDITLQTGEKFDCLMALPK